jgi:hypothetical protein
MPQLPDGYPDFLTAESGELIDGQYADRPQLRPILDAVLAMLPALGPVTVQARKTIVSLVTPRRTFAVVQATTRTGWTWACASTTPSRAADCRAPRASAAAAPRCGSR